MKTDADKQAQEAPPEDALPQDALPQGLEETLYLLSIPGMRECIQASMQAPESECSSELSW